MNPCCNFKVFHPIIGIVIFLAVSCQSLAANSKMKAGTTRFITNKMCPYGKFPCKYINEVKCDTLLISLFLPIQNC